MSLPQKEKLKKHTSICERFFGFKPKEIFMGS